MKRTDMITGRLPTTGFEENPEGFRQPSCICQVIHRLMDHLESREGTVALLRWLGHF
jgi:hypothetical protein